MSAKTAEVSTACDPCNCHWGPPGKRECDVELTRKYGRLDIPLECPKGLGKLLRRTRKKLFNREKRVLDYIWGRQDGGASVQKTATNLGIPYHDAQHIFNRLIKIGEIFNKGEGMYCSTAWALAFDPRPMTERLHEELKKALNLDGPPAEVFNLLEEYAAARKVGATKAQAWHLAKKNSVGVGT